MRREEDVRRGRAGVFLASSMPGVGALVREQFGFAADMAQPSPAATSSLHAVVAAAAALGARELDVAVAGGAELGLDPVWLTAQARAGTLARDEMRVYAADPAGLLPGEGCGMVVLVRSADAQAAGLPIYAEIAGWSTVPVLRSALDGRAVLEAYRQAGIDPADIQLIEGEGTGTAVGDLAELSTFAQLRNGCRATAALGAVAAGLGYTRAAAGVASLIKTALAMAVGVIPPGTGCARQHPLIESGDALLRLPRQPEPWPDGNVAASGTRLAAVNSLGTADPAAESDPYGLRTAEGVHLVLGREAEGHRGRGRRRRAAETAAPVGAAQAQPVTPGLPGPVTAPTVPVALAAPVAAVVRQPADADSAAPTVPVSPATPAAAAIPVAAGVVMAPTVPAAAVAPVSRARAAGSWDGRAGQLSVFVLCGADVGAVAGQLEVIAGDAAAMSAADLRGLARQLAVDALRNGDLAQQRSGEWARAGSEPVRPDQRGPVRVALTAATPAQLAERARSAVRRLAGDGPTAAADSDVRGPTAAAGADLPGPAAGADLHGPAAGAGVRGSAAGDADVHVSVGATGRVAVLFGGLAEPGLAQSARLAGSLAALRTLDGLGVKPGTAVGYSLGEITGLVWAGCLPAAEAARLVAQCGQVLRGCSCGPAAMARVAADVETARALGAPDRLYIAAYEGERCHVLAGSTTGIRNLTRRAAAAGVAVELLGVTHALHSPAMARCGAPLRGVFGGTRFAAPRRQLISTVTGGPVLPGEDLAELLAGQLSRPVQFASAMAVAAQRADLIVTAGPDEGLAQLAAACCAVPCVAVPGAPPGVRGTLGAGPRGTSRAGAWPGGAYPAATARAVAALFAAGAIRDAAVLNPGGPQDAPASGLVPRMRDGEPTGPRATVPSR